MRLARLDASVEKLEMAWRYDAGQQLNVLFYLSLVVERLGNDLFPPS